MTAGAMVGLRVAMADTDAEGLSELFLGAPVDPTGGPDPACDAPRRREGRAPGGGAPRALLWAMGMPSQIPAGR
jgi:hypothetical protein